MQHLTSVCSRIFGKIADTKFPLFLQDFINNSYIKHFNIDMNKFEKKEYKSLNELFTRALNDKKSVQDGFISPSDGFITECGIIENNKALQIKNMSYNVSSALDGFDTSILENGYFLNIYLSPKDYHRYHSPIDMQVLRAKHIPGKLYPVNFKFLNKKLNLFIENERVILECKTENGKVFYMLFVGALNVGRIKFNFDENLSKNISSTKSSFFEYKDLKINKAEELGRFEMGSTIVLFFQKDSFHINAKVNQSLEFGQKLGNSI